MDRSRRRRPDPATDTSEPRARPPGFGLAADDRRDRAILAARGGRAASRGLLKKWERDAIVDFHDRNPLEGYRRLTFMMLRANAMEPRGHDLGMTSGV
jgi:hypothetical protein